MAVMVTRVYFGFIFETNSMLKHLFWLMLLIREHKFRLNSCRFQKLFLLLPPS